jgi:hypothetical protein
MVLPSTPSDLNSACWRCRYFVIPRDIRLLDTIAGHVSCPVLSCWYSINEKPISNQDILNIPLLSFYLGIFLRLIHCNVLPDLLKHPSTSPISNYHV